MNVAPETAGRGIRLDGRPTPGGHCRAGLKCQQLERRGPQFQGDVAGRRSGDRGKDGGFQGGLVTANPAVEGHSGRGRQGLAIHGTAAIHCYSW